jgi:DNA-directed RNA polymerase subunit RPC12/RpoP
LDSSLVDSILPHGLHLVLLCHSELAKTLETEEVSDMSERVTVRLNANLRKACEQDAKQKDVSSFNEYVVMALEHYLTCSKLELSAQMRLIVLKYDGKCLRCGKEVKAGNWALYGRGVGIVCMDCYVERIGDKPLVAKYLKLREWKQILKALKGECERYAQELEDFRLFERLKGMDETVEKLNKAIMEYLRQKIGTAEEAQALEEITRQLKDLRALTATIRELYKKLSKRKKLDKSVYA